MINKIISFSLNNRLIIGILTLGLIAWGGYNFTILPIDAVPDITNNQVQVITVAPSLAPQEVEQFITFPVEIAMANIQDVTEIRSISRFGLSVVTIVFKDRVDPYLARQLVSEQIKIAESNIPEGYGTPEMMPITTGLGEIYQYVIEPLPGYEDIYTPLEIRTIQDWIIKRQLSGIPGIVEISSFGGYLKQYEVTVKPRTLVGKNLTITEIFEALEKNNENTGGGYIEKGQEALYIRAEGIIQNEEDIENIVIKVIDGIPILIKDVAEVNISHPPRFGAMTKDGKGEAVGGITLMLKGGNSASIIKEVKARIEQVKKTLPEGITLHAYLDRSQMISKTINTVSKNLIEGGLIVIFILILLLGNYRAGLIVASVIPLSMLFAFSMMNLFGVSANLMSLGAIDFGLIVDGSVIVIEGIVYQIHRGSLKGKLSQEEIDKNIYIAGSRVSKSAVFGVLIILIVYIPILAFTGIEGKMFKPMAQTVIFALVGALILSLTYVPVMASIFLSKKISHKESFADKIIHSLHKAHAPVLDYSLRHKWLVLAMVLALLGASFFLFSRMGGEFIPTLEEGDLAAQMTLAPGSSLSESIATSTKAERIILDNFPEVKEVVSKIGTAEVPTDPMAVEDADIMIVMKPREEWTSAKTRVQLVEMMKEKLSVLPGVSFEFTQPIQLRFNELMTGVKSDVAVKIYGEDLNLLYEKANEAAAVISNIRGAGDVRVEQIVGLPQLIIRYKRDKLAQYGLNVEDINRIIRIAFGGEPAGVVYEGERRFDLVLRLCEECRNNLHAIENLRVNSPSGELILLSQVADLEIKDGPMQISRDDTKRRITIGINVRERDVESFINEVDNNLSQMLQLPPGYYITFGGQFENLKEAKRTSSIAVPVSLIVILVLLYFTFYSLKQALMIYSAIPLAAVGGIWALWLRGMPFSISAGVGFIALFGVAVLNGIVLLSYYNELEKSGVKDIYERVRQGTRTRLRPVIMTASVAALGFVPMALSTAPGAEVQKPLATVVIGGLITATILTLVVLPVIYILFSKMGSRAKIKTPAKALSLFILMSFPAFLIAQDKPMALSLENAVQTALENNLELKNADLEREMEAKLRKSAIDIPQPEFMLEQGQINSDAKDYNISIAQSFRFPTVYSSAYRVQKEQELLRETEYRLSRNEIIIRVTWSYLRWIKSAESRRILLNQDSLYKEFKDVMKMKYEQGEENHLAKLMADSKAGQVRNKLLEAKSGYIIAENDLRLLTGIQKNIEAASGNYLMLPEPGEKDVAESPLIDYFRQQVNLKQADIRNQTAGMFPDISLGYFNQSIDRVQGFQGWMVGVSLPVWFWSGSGKIQAAKIDRQISENHLMLEKIRLSGEYYRISESIKQRKAMLKYYEEIALLQAKTLEDNALISFEQGEIDYTEFVQMTGEAMQIQLDYLDAMEQYNLSVLEMYELTGETNLIIPSLNEN
ncbi:MAG: CusA/CzcA family heavy metal efflux RND transporter [Bacteroidetes bacterium]|nr:CusA/CzcA family heavy metal efflux RND transporter [Bacteroidota bacterium]